MSNFTAVNLRSMMLIGAPRSNPKKRWALIPIQGNPISFIGRHSGKSSKNSLGISQLSWSQRGRHPFVDSNSPSGPIGQEWFTSPRCSRCTSGLALAAFATNETWCRPSSVSLGVGWYNLSILTTSKRSNFVNMMPFQGTFTIWASDALCALVCSRSRHGFKG